MVTAENEKELILDSIDNGAVDFIVKPYTVDRVKESFVIFIKISSLSKLL